MTHKPTVWIDLTDLSLWSGNHTGIQRVVYNLAVRYNRDGNARYFVYEEKSKSFYEVDLSIVTPPPPVSGEMTKGRALREETTSRVRNYYVRLPESWRYNLSPILKPVVKGAYNKAHHMVYITKRRLRRAGKKEVYQPAVFGAGDSVIILGAGWARPTILAELWKIKQKTAFKVIHFIHDVIPIYHPHLFGPGHFELFTRYLFDAAQVTDYIVTNSEASKRDTLRFFGELDLPKPPIGVIRLSDELELDSEPQKPNLPIEPGNYILTLGTIEIRKNAALLYAAYKLAKLKGVKLPKLVIAGRPGWLAGDTVYAAQHDPDVEDLIFISPSPHDTELDWLYRNCMYFVYPSMYEGWGMPIAEALVYGKMALTTNISSMPEIAGDLLEYFNPFDAAACMELLAKYTDPEVRAKAEARVQSEYKVQTWDMTYREFLKRVAEMESQTKV